MSRLNPDYEQNMMREIVKDWTDYEVDIRMAADRLAFAALSQHRLQHQTNSARATLRELRSQLSDLESEALSSRSGRYRSQLDIDFNINQVEDEISEIKSDIDRMEEEIARLQSLTFHSDFPEFVNLCHSNIRNKARTLLPICSIAYAYAVAGSEGTWPPTLPNLEKELEDLEAEYKLAEEQVDSFIDDAEESFEDLGLADRVIRIRKAKIDLWNEPSEIFREVAGSDNDIALFRTVVNAEIHRRVKRWQVARMQEWVSASEVKPHSKLQASLRANNYKYQLELMNPPSEVTEELERDQHSVSHTASAMWTSPIISHSWHRRLSAPHMRLRRHVEQGRRADSSRRNEDRTLAGPSRDDEDEAMADAYNALVPFAPEISEVMDPDDLVDHMGEMFAQVKGEDTTVRNFAEEALQLRRGQLMWMKA